MTSDDETTGERMLQGGDPQAQRDHAPLAEGEGVNAGSNDATAEGARSNPGPGSTPVPGGENGPGGDTVSGGDPDDAPDLTEGLTGYGATGDDTELVGTPGEEASGQDDGSME